MTRHENGLVVFFDGPDWVGKTTQVELSASKLRDDGFTVTTKRAHGGTEIGEMLRTVSLSKVDRPVQTDAFISFALHAALAEELTQRRQKGEICLIDRSPLSIWGYQVYGDGLSADEYGDLIDRDLAQFKPDLVLVYQASLATLEARKSARNDQKSDYFDSKDANYFTRVLEGYSYAAERYAPDYQVVVIDANQELTQVTEQTQRAISYIM